MNFRKYSKRPLIPPPPLPPSFLENHIADFATKVRDFATKVHMFIMAGLLYILYDPISHEMHEVQMFNMLMC